MAPLLLINWTNEEGARFSPPMMGSGAAMGIFTEAEVLAKRDQAGAVFGEELRRIGWQGEVDPAELQTCAAYLELHIEQGKLLEDAGLDVGVVTHALAQHWFEVVGGGRGRAWRLAHGRAAGCVDGGGAADRGRRGDRPGDAGTLRRAGPRHGRRGRGLSLQPQRRAEPGLLQRRLPPQRPGGPGAHGRCPGGAGGGDRGGAEGDGDGDALLVLRRTRLSTRRWWNARAKRPGHAG
ncbi:hypothetical protein [Dankookia sp. P2]|uniref:hypothetical protein n=1 Tax=Dankookia sp. P2 TaxID=3423955 RepID=UPI003D66C7A2